MPASLDAIRGFLDERKIRHFSDPSDTALVMPFRLSPRFSSSVMVKVEDDGRYLQIMCRDLPLVEGSHPMIGELQQCLLAMNMRKRFVKFSQDPLDGEIVASGEAWLEDMPLTSDAFHRMMGNFLACLREAHDCVESVLAGRGMPEDTDEDEDESTGDSARDAA